MPRLEASALYIEIARQHALTRQVNVRALEGITPSFGESEPALQKLPLTAVLEYWQQVAELCDEPGFGLKAGNQCHLSAYGIFSNLLLSCPTLRRAIQMGVLHLHKLNEALETHLAIGEEISCYTLAYHVGHPAARHHIEFHLASVVHLGRQIVRQRDSDRLRPLQVDFSHAPGFPAREYEAVFGCPVRFQQPRNQMVFSSELLNLPGHSPNISLYSHLLKLMEAVDDQATPATPVTDKVYGALKKQPPSSDWPTLESTASSLGLSASSLKRKLKRERTSYQGICDDLRYRQAKRMLSKRQYTVGEIAHHLGFSSSASFSRSFKRWSGVAPHDYLQRKGYPDQQSTVPEGDITGPIPT